MGDFIELIKEGFRLAMNVGRLALDAVRATVIGYLQRVKKWSIRLFIWALVPLPVVVLLLMFQQPLGWVYGAYVVYFALLVAAELLLLLPVYLIWKRVKAIFPTVASDLEEWIDFIKNVVFNGLSLGIFVTLIPVWNSPGAFPLLLLVAACWLTLPACSISSFCKRIYPAIRAIQLLFLSGLLVLEMAYPIQMKQLIYVIEVNMGKIITAPVNQREITSEWSSLQWFNNAGKPQVWYSGSSEFGFRLWAAPGFDLDSGQELHPVQNLEVRNKIIARFNDESTRQAERTNEQRKLELDRIARNSAAAKKLGEGWPQTGVVDEEINILEKHVIEGSPVNSMEVPKTAVVGKDIVFLGATGWGFSYGCEFRNDEVVYAVNMASAGEAPKWVKLHPDQKLGELAYDFKNYPLGTSVPAVRIKVLLGEPVKIVFKCKRNTN